MGGRHRPHLIRALGIGAVVAGLAMATGPNAVAGQHGDSTSGRSAVGLAAADVGWGPPGAHKRSGTPVSVTLLTGDGVILPSRSATSGSVVPGKDRAGVGFLTRRVDGHLYVIPTDAVPLLRTHALDRRLFDITGLVADRYDDAHRANVPLIVSYPEESARVAGRDALARAGGGSETALQSVHATAVQVTKAKATAFWDTVAPRHGSVRALGTGVERIWLDGVRRPVLDQSVPQIGAPAAWKAGFTGKGVTVAVLDTGIDATHPDLAGQITAAQDFSGEGPGDGFGHGTHVASIIAGTAKASDGRYKGVAPDAKLLDGKVCDSGGFCSESAMIAGMQWAATTEKAKVVNISIGGEDTPEVDPLEEAVNSLTAQTGTLFVVAAGNSGPNAGTIESPGSADAALTVGAVDKQDGLADFSSQGPRKGDGAIKPDLTAPGVDIVAARAKDTELGEPVGDTYVRLSGTSMATPHVAGSAALLAQQHQDWNATQLKSTLTASAKVLPDQSVFAQGAGRVDVAKAITQTVSADGSVAFGVARWPHTDDKPVTRTVTYRNTGAAAVQLALGAEMTGPDGAPAPESAVKLSATSLIVPAGGTASVDVTSDTRHDGPDGLYSGRVTATGGGQSLSVPLGLDKEVESYDLTIKRLDAQGKPTSDGNDLVFGQDVEFFEFPPIEDGMSRLRLPKGRYLVESDQFVGGSPGFTSLVQPLVTLDKAVTVVADARKAKPVSVTVARTSVRPALVDLGYDLNGTFGLGSGVIVQDFSGLSAAHLGPAMPAARFVSHLASQWGVRGAAGDYAESPYFYGLTNVQPRRFFTGFQRAVRDRDLAKVTTRYARQLPGRQGNRFVTGFAPGMSGAWSQGMTFSPPFKVIEYLEPGDVRWSTDMSEWAPDADGFPSDQTLLTSPDRTYRAGQSYAEQWNGAVFGPAMDAGSDLLAARLGDEIYVGLPMYADAAGHLGDSLTDEARTTLYRNGTKVAESTYAGFLDDLVTVRGAKASFRLEVSAARPTYSQLSTKIDTAWSFTSKRVPGDDPQTIPLWAIRFSPHLDQLNRSHEGRKALVPVTLQAQEGAPVGKPEHLVVDVSVDDGTTWQRAETVPAGDGRWVAVVETPASAKYVSLRAEASDSKGNTVQQTIVRAYTVGS